VPTLKTQLKSHEIVHILQVDRHSREHSSSWEI